MCDKKKKNKKKKKKNEETEPIFEVAYLGNARSDFAQIWNVECCSWGGMSTAKIVLFHQGSTELRRCENCVFFLPVNILTGVTRRLLGPHDTLPCVLIHSFYHIKRILSKVERCCTALLLFREAPATIMR